MQLSNSSKAISTWLFIGVFMVFIQVIIGGVTRLTGSGLSITKWEIVTGTLPPLSETHWQQEFELYKATPQYQKINEGMSMPDFKFIYFWEYFHRLWARLMGFVFAIPFVIFWRKNYFDNVLKKRLIVIFLLACLVASFGWIMVASGLINRPWVNAYKLSMHLCLAIFLFGYLLYTALMVRFPNQQVVVGKSIKKFGNLVLVVLAIQLFLGGLMSGMKAGLFYPTWPKMGNEWIPQTVLNFYDWKLDHLSVYDSNTFAVTQVQFFHRLLAYILTAFIIAYYLRIRNTNVPFVKHLLPLAVLLQVIIGIITVINCNVHIPVFWGVLHQAGAIILLSVFLATIYFTKTEKIKQL